MSLAALLEKTGVAVAVADDTGLNLPESPETLAAQALGVKAKRQRAMMFPTGTPETELPAGLARVETERGIFHFDPKQITAEAITTASAARRENEVLGLGPASKADVQALAAKGEPVGAVVERTPDGVEVKGAIVTPTTAPATLREMESRKASANVLRVEPVTETLARREAPAKTGGGLSALLSQIGQPAASQSTAQNTINQAGRGALDQGLYQGLEGLARMAAAGTEEAKATLPGSTTLRLQREREELQAHNRRIAGVSEGRGDEPSYAPPLTPEEEKQMQTNAARIAAITQQLDTGRAQSLPSQYAGAIADLRGRIGNALPVDEAFAQSLGGQIIAGLGQAAGTLPTFVIPGAGPSMSIGQLFQQGREDALAKGADAATADAAGFANVPAAALDIASDKLVIGKILKPLRGKLTVGQLVAAVGVNAAAGGASNAGQQAWQNVVARSLAGYDPSRPIDDGVVNALVVGAAVAGTATAVGQAVTQAKAPRPQSEAPEATLAEDGALTGRADQTQAATPAAEGDGLTSPPAQPEQATPAKPKSGLNALLERVGFSRPNPSGADAAPKIGSRAATLAEQINARPADHWRDDVAPENLTGPDVDLVSQLADYATQTRERGVEDFAPFAARMTAAFGDKVTPYLRTAWETSSGGKTPADLETATAPLQLDGPAKRALSWGKLFWQGAADTLREAGLRSLATAVDQHVDLADRNLGKAASLLPSGRIPAEVSKQFEAIIAARENGREGEAAQLIADAHPQTRDLVAAVGRMMEYTGRENQRIGVRVTDAEGNVRPIGFLGEKAFPRVLRDDVAAVLRNPNENRALWEKMKDELVAGGFIKDRADAVEYLRSARPDDTTSKDFFGGLERARAKSMPEGWREYRYEKIVPQYVAGWAERAAQIEAFGQKIDAKDRDAFDVALETTRDPELTRYIERTREHAYGVNRLSQGTRRALSNLTGGTTALLLGNPYSSLRNLIGGVAQTSNQFGVTKAIGHLHEAWGAIKDVQAAGGLKADIADLIFAGETATTGQKAAGLALKINGFSAVEQFVRAHNWLTAKAFLRDALAQLSKNPQSRASKQALAFLRRYEADAATLHAEQGKGPATEAFLRRAVRQAQGGYKYDQCPLFTTGPVGRFLLQFSRWGLMATRFHAEHAIRPAIIGELVPVRTRNGKTEMQRVRTLAPLLRSPLVAMVAGATTYALRSALFGVDRMDADWDEVFKTMDEDDQRGLELALGRMGNDIVAGSTFGALTSYADLLARAVDQGQFKSPIDPPSVAIAREIALLGYKAKQQGRLSRQDLRQFAGRIVTAYRYDAPLAYRFADATQAEWQAAERYRAEQDKRFAASVGRRYAEERGYAAKTGPVGILPIGNQNSPVYDDLTDALHAGDPDAVRAVVKAALADSRGRKNFHARIDLLRSQALARQPLAPGGRVGEDEQNAFRSWMSQRLTDEQRERIEDAQRRYFDTGTKAGLFTEGNSQRYAQP